MLVAPAVYIASDELLALLVAYARAGGHLVLTPRTGYADAEGRMRAEVMPGVARAAAGVRYLEYTNLTRPVRVEGLGGKATGWVTSMGARNAQGRRLRFLANWSWEPAEVKVPECVQDVLNKERFEAGASLPLGPWDVRVLVAELP